jgi:hypothetical protein
MDQKLVDLKNLAEKLPKGAKENAVALVERMGQKIEGIGDESKGWRAPSSRVVQPSSDRSKLPKNAGIGTILIDDRVEQQPLKTIPLRMWDSRQLWSPDKDDAKILCYSPNGKVGSKYGICASCQFGKFDVETNRSACNKGKTFINIKADLSDVFMTTFYKTNYKNGTSWSKLMTKAGVAPFKRVYEMKTETSKEYKNVESLLVNVPDKTSEAITPDEYIPFLEALFLKITEDREQHLKNFEEMVANKGSEVAMLEDKTVAGEDGVAIESLPTPEQSSMAKKYTL